MLQEKIQEPSNIYPWKICMSRLCIYVERQSMLNHVANASFIVGPYEYHPYCCFSFLLFLFLFLLFFFQTLKAFLYFYPDILPFPFSFVVCWLYFWYVDHISGMLTIFLVCWPYFWYFDHISGMLAIFLVCWPNFWPYWHIVSFMSQICLLHGSQCLWKKNVMTKKK